MKNKKLVLKILKNGGTVGQSVLQIKKGDCSLSQSPNPRNGDVRWYQRRLPFLSPNETL